VISIAGMAGASPAVLQQYRHRASGMHPQLQ
jgi:hypothetical protein